MANADKKRWTTPKLRIFVRTGTEERVLAGCKNTTLRTGNAGINATCRYWQGFCVNCDVITAT